jgi:hypothetical protein
MIAAQGNVGRRQTTEKNCSCVSAGCFGLNGLMQYWLTYARKYPERCVEP